MKVFITAIVLCFCVSTYAQNDESSSKEKTESFAPFAWYQKQLEEKENEAHLRKGLEELLEGLKSTSVSDESTRLVTIGDKMPVYPVDETTVAPMPVIPVDTTVTHYLRVYPEKRE